MDSGSQGKVADWSEGMERQVSEPSSRPREPSSKSEASQWAASSAATSSSVGMMSESMTGVPSGATPTGSVERSTSIVPASE